MYHPGCCIISVSRYSNDRTGIYLIVYAGTFFITVYIGRT